MALPIIEMLQILITNQVPTHLIIQVHPIQIEGESDTVGFDRSQPKSSPRF